MSVPTVSKELLSGSSDGSPIAVAATATPGTTIHTAVAGTTAGTYDEVWIWASNISASAVTLTIEFGGVGTSDKIVTSLPATSGPVLVVPGIPLQNSKVVKAFAGSASVVNVAGYVNAMVAG